MTDLIIWSCLGAFGVGMALGFVIGMHFFYEEEKK